MKHREILVSVRMPASLVTRLKELLLKEHYLDLSEQVRTILRNKWLEATDKVNTDEPMPLTKKKILDLSLKIAHDKIMNELQEFEDHMKKEQKNARNE